MPPELEEGRADPDALLRSVRYENRGRLTVFLGSAAGVGKTYAMLQAARERLAEGTDLAVAWVETHSRAETEALRKGLPELPSKHLEYQGKVFAEMDLDAVLARRPRLALVDELAHTNIPGSRHTRRYQDVEEILAAGIDVYSTLNIQHVESLNDAVARITGVAVRETVPDRILAEAEIKLVDIPPEELRQRLNEGKVYVPEQAREAIRKFFRPGNLGALRELALRYAARRVEQDLETYMQAHAIAGPWPTGEKVMVCVSASPLSAQLIRSAYRLATSLKAEWLAAHIATPHRGTACAKEDEALQANLRLAEELGAEIITIVGDDVAEEIIRAARRRNITHLILGKPLQSDLRRWLHGSIINSILRRSEGMSVHVITGKTRGTHPDEAPRRAPMGLRPLPTFFALGLVLVVTAVGKAFEQDAGLVNIALAFLLPVMVAAIAWGRATAVFTSLLAVVCFDLLFVPPVLRVTVADTRYIFSFGMFILVALITGTMAGRLRHHAHQARKREVRIEALYTLSKSMAGEGSLPSILAVAARKTAEAVFGDVVLMLPDAAGGLTVMETADPHGGKGDSFLNTNEEAVAAWVFGHGLMAGRGTDTLGGATGLYLPLPAENHALGVLGIRLHTNDRTIVPEKRHLLEAFASLIALAVKRARLAEEADRAFRLEESERLWMALFNSLSHDLRTPLSSVIGAVTGLLEGGDLYSPAARRELLLTVEEEARRMNRLIGNLFDMARLKSGMLQLKKDWCDVEDIIGVAVGRFSRSLGNRPVSIETEPNLPLVPADLGLIEQVVINLLENALKYSPPGGAITIVARRENGNLQVSVADQGRGIDVKEAGLVFDQFYRGQDTRHISGTGLGLTIAKAVVEAHGGRIWAAPNPAGGTIIVFTLPLGDEKPGEIPVAKGGDTHE